MNKSKFYVAHLDAEKVLIVDVGEGLSITNDAENAVMKLNADLLAGGSGGIQGRKVFYRDTNGDIDEMLTKDGEFAGFKFCSAAQQDQLKALFSINLVLSS